MKDPDNRCRRHPPRSDLSSPEDPNPRFRVPGQNAIDVGHALLRFD